MKNSRRWLISVVYIVLGAVLFGCSFAGIVDEFWSGMGSAFVFIGILQLVRHIRYRTNETYRERVDVETKDERNRYIGNKAWAWAGYWFVMLGAVGTIVFRILGKNDLSIFCGSSVCLIMVLYWISYLYLRKKY